MRLRPFLLSAAIVVLPLQGQAAVQHIEEQHADGVIQSMYRQLEKKELSMPARLDEISAVFLNKPYLLGALGEGLSGQYDQYPLYRADAFDCLTYVETVLAIALTHHLSSFKQCIKRVRYHDGEVSYITRNHFTDLDWNINNQHRGILKDITAGIHDEHNKPVMRQARAKINKSSWYEHFSIEKIRLSESVAEEQGKRLSALKEEGKRFSPQYATIPYVPLSALFDAQGEPNHYLFKQIPDGALIEIVRPNWHLSELIGTNLNVSHLGFAFWHNNQLLFRNASSKKGQVVDQPLIDYLYDARQSPTIKGINVQVVLPAKNC